MDEELVTEEEFRAAEEFRNWLKLKGLTIETVAFEPETGRVTITLLPDIDNGTKRVPQ